MADAKIMTFGELFSPTTDVIPDDRAAAVEIEGLDGNDYIKIDTTDGEEAVRLVGSGTGNVGIGSGFTTPQERLHIADSGSEGVLLKFTTGDTGHGDTDGSFIGLDHNDNFNIANRETAKSIFFQTQGLTRGGIWYDGRAEFRGSMNVGNMSTPGTSSVAIGDGATCAGDYSFTSGYGTSCVGNYSVAIGSHSNIGNGALSHAIAIGYSTQSNADYNTSIGFEVKGHNKYGVALGGANWEATKGAIQTEFIRGLVETTDDSDTELKDAAKGTGFKVLTSNTGLNKDFVMDIRIVLNSICTANGDTFVVGDFVSREYNFTGRYLYDASSPTFVLYSGNGTTYTSGTANSLRTSIRSNSNASDKLGHDTEGVVDSFVMDATGGCGRLTLKVHPQDPNATVFHSAKIWTESTVAIAS